jgi:hypothetical protein
MMVVVWTKKCVKNTMNCISTLFLPRNRQISIPKPQAFMEVPQKFSKKKPLFNKKSGHQSNLPGGESALLNAFALS